MLVRCAGCGHALSADLTRVAADFEWVSAENEYVVAKGQLWEDFAPVRYGGISTLVMHPEDVRGTTSDLCQGASGCCGNSAHVTTHHCERCLAPIGTDISDCYTGLYFYIPSNAVVVGEPPTVYRHRWDQALSKVDIAQARVYRRGQSRFFVTAWARSSMGLWFEVGLVSEQSLATPGSAVVEAFGRSNLDQDPSDVSDIWDDLARSVEVSTKTQLISGLEVAHIAQTAESITVTPMANPGVAWIPFRPVPPLAIQFESNHLSVDVQQLNEAVYEAIGLSDLRSADSSSGSAPQS